MGATTQAIRIVKQTRAEPVARAKSGIQALANRSRNLHKKPYELAMSPANPSFFFDSVIRKAEFLLFASLT
jgi:hypothetical protein